MVRQTLPSQKDGKVHVTLLGFCCGSRLPVFGVRGSVTFHLTYVIIILVRFRLLSGHLLGNSCSFGYSYVLFCILTICNISYFLLWFRGLDLSSDCSSS